jgi:branched-chain amino acid transport system permease protein
MAALQAGHFPAPCGCWWAAACTLAVDAFSATGRRSSAARPCGTWPIRWRWRRCCGWPLASLPAGAVLLTLAIVVPMGPMLYRVAFQPVAEAPVLVLLIISVAVHLAMVGLGLLIFGPKVRAPAVQRGPVRARR